MRCVRGARKIAAFLVHDATRRGLSSLLKFACQLLFIYFTYVHTAEKVAASYRVFNAGSIWVAAFTQPNRITKQFLSSTETNVGSST